MLTFQERVLCGNPLQRFGSGLEPDPEPTREFGPVANTTQYHHKEVPYMLGIAKTLHAQCPIIL